MASATASRTDLQGPVIGVFDSGFGGLTVLRALLPLVPGAHYLYLGDTARLPYGAKSQATIARYAVESARLLEDRGAEFLVIACNTATALALPEICAAVSIPVVGVIEPVVEQAARQIEREQVLVLATEATVQSHAYRDACARHGLQAVEKACPLLVPLVEEGWTHHPVTREVLAIYLSEALLSEALLADSLRDSTPAAVLLGCTHYPLIADEIEAKLRELGSDAILIDSAQATANAVAALVGAQADIAKDTPATFQCFATDSVEKFRRLGSAFLGREIAEVELIDLGG
jgi:glutamate racemase